MRDIPPTCCVSPVGTNKKVCEDKTKYVKSKVNNPRLFLRPVVPVKGTSCWHLVLPLVTNHECHVSCSNIRSCASGMWHEV
jgi:hypothetical protein